MKEISVLDRIFLLATGLLAAYQIALGMNGMKPQPILFYTIGFGILLVAGLLLIILGFEGLESQLVVIISTLIPLNISLGLISEFRTGYALPYLFFSAIGFFAVAVTRYTAKVTLATVILAIVHGIAGMIIFLLPIILWIRGDVPAGYLLVSVGGGLIGIGGLLLAFFKTGNPILSQQKIYTLLPTLLFLMTAAFIAGFSFH